MDPSALLQRRQRLAEEISSIDEQLMALRQSDRHLMRGKEVHWEPAVGLDPKGAPILRAVAVSPHLGFNTNSMRAAFIEIPPHSQEGAYHRHGEAVKYYLSGRAIEKIGDKTYEVGEGDIVFIPANTWHGTQNPNDGSVKIWAVSQALGANVETPVLHSKR